MTYEEVIQAAKIFVRLAKIRPASGIRKGAPRLLYREQCDQKKSVWPPTTR